MSSFSINTTDLNSTKALLDQAFEQFHRLDFVVDDPICLPHRFTKKQDIEIIAFWVAILAWGHRSSIINSGKKLIEKMDRAPYDFVLNHSEKDRKRFLDFKHRTFQPDDALYFLSFLQWHYQNYDSLESAFVPEGAGKFSIKQSLDAFYPYFFSLEHLPRTKKHISRPQTGSACKRLNMFLRWMVRRGDVDFGIWNTISLSKLMVPLDVHVLRTAQKLKLTKSKKSDWNTLEEIMQHLRAFDPDDPAKYDFALFGLSIGA